MKRKVFVLLLTLILMSINNSYAGKARNIVNNNDSNYHATHLEQHLNSTDLHGTGNYLKIRKEAKNSKVLGHLEQADHFILLELKNGFAKIDITESNKTSPDSWVGLSGWVDSDYIDCFCSDAKYHSQNPNAFSSVSGDSLIPSDAIGEYIFCSGAGAWMTQITLYSDGSFVGNYHDADMGDNGNAYPNGTHYFCNFSGQFADLQKINDYTYSMTLDRLTPWEAKDHIRGGVKYIASVPYGVEYGRSFLIYTPETPMNVLSESFLIWMNGPLAVKPAEKLGCYAIYSQETGYAFFLAAV